MLNALSVYQVQWKDSIGETYCHGYCHPMLVCPPGLPIAFYEMPKAASSSLKQLLAGFDIPRFQKWEAQGQPVTCCKYGLQRLKVVIVRNPFSRLESFFKMFVWQNEMGESSIHNYARDSMNPPLELRLQKEDKIGATDSEGNVKEDTFGDEVAVNSWEDFPTVVQAVIATEDKILNYHSMSQVGLWNDPQGFAAQYDPKEFVVIHLENLHEEWKAMTKLLCDKYHHCAPVPVPEKINAGGGEESVEEATRINQRWPEALVKRFVARFRCDFEYFGYSFDPHNRSWVGRSDMRTPMSRCNQNVFKPVSIPGMIDGWRETRQGYLDGLPDYDEKVAAEAHQEPPVAEEEKAMAVTAVAAVAPNTASSMSERFMDFLR